MRTPAVVSVAALFGYLSAITGWFTMAAALETWHMFQGLFVAAGLVVTSVLVFVGGILAHVRRQRGLYVTGAVVSALTVVVHVKLGYGVALTLLIVVLALLPAVGVALLFTRSAGGWFQQAGH